MNKILLTTATAFAFTLTQGLQASILTLTPGPAENAIEHVNISQGATATISGTQGNRTYALTTLDGGLRWKKVSPQPPNLNIYVAQLFAQNAAAFVRSANDHTEEKTASLDSLTASGSVAIQLQYLFALTSDKLRGAFTAALSANDVNLQAPEIVAFLNASTGPNAKVGSTLAVVGEKFAAVGNNPPTEIITVEMIADPSSTDDAIRDVKVTAIPGPAGFACTVFSMWLGTVPEDDAGLVALKAALTK